MNLSVVVPAHNEERYIVTCLNSVTEQCGALGITPEIIVVCNRCTDRTGEVARSQGATTIDNDSRNLSNIRNTGIRHTTGEVIITIDADSIVTFEYIREVAGNIRSGRYVGGGTRVAFSRKSAGITATKLLLDLYVKVSGLSCGAFWFYRKYYDAINGFDETLHFGEDIHFARRLRALGKTMHLKYGTAGNILTSTRKFDRYGDWYFFKLITFKQNAIKNSMSGKDLSFVNEYFYDFNDRKSGG